MININSVTLVGRLTRDIELRKTNSNASYCRFTVAVDRRFQSQQTNGQTSDFISCVAWRQSADFLASYAGKGTIVAIEGRIQTGSYDGPNGKVYTTDVVADSVQIISSRNQAGVPAGNGNYNQNQNQNYNPQPSAPTFTPQSEPAYSADTDDDFSNTPSLEITGVDLPFF